MSQSNISLENGLICLWCGIILHVALHDALIWDPQNCWRAGSENVCKEQFSKFILVYNFTIQFK